MPAPQNVALNFPLTTFAVGYRPGQFIADQVLPAIPVNDKAGTYYVFGKDNLNNEMDGPRAPKDPAVEVDYSLSSATYDIERYDFAELLPDSEKRNFAMGEDAAEEAVVQNIMDRLLLAKEARAAALLFSTSNITNNTTLSGTDQWSDYNNSDPLSNIETGLGTTEDATAKPTNELSVTMGNAVWRKLKHHPNIVARYQYTSGGGVTLAQFAELIGIKPENLHIGMAKYNTADEGQTAVLGNVWGKGFLVHYTEPVPRGLRTLTLGATITFAGENGTSVRSWRSNNPAGDWHAAEMNYVQKVVAADAGYYIDAAVA